VIFKEIFERHKTSFLHIIIFDKIDLLNHNLLNKVLGHPERSDGHDFGTFVGKRRAAKSGHRSQSRVFPAQSTLQPAVQFHGQCPRDAAPDCLGFTVTVFGRTDLYDSGMRVLFC